VSGIRIQDSGFRNQKSGISDQLSAYGCVLIMRMVVRIHSL